MIVIAPLSALSQAAGKSIASSTQAGARLVVEVSGAAGATRCPGDARRSSRVDGRFVRTLADCTAFGQPVTLRVRAWRFKCDNAACAREVLRDGEPLAAAHQRRTRGLHRAHGLATWALGVRADARLGMRVHGSAP